MSVVVGEIWAEPRGMLPSGKGCRLVGGGVWGCVCVLHGVRIVFCGIIECPEHCSRADSREHSLLGISPGFLKPITAWVDEFRPLLFLLSLDPETCRVARAAFQLSSRNQLEPEI